MPKLRPLVQLARPLFLLFSALTFFLGAGIARYLGNPLWVSAWLILAWVFLLQIAAAWLTACFAKPTEPLPGVETLRQREDLRVLLIQASAAALTLLAAITILMLALGLLNLPSMLLMGFSLFLLLAYGVPPARLVGRGFGELAQAIFLSTCVPALAFLQTAPDIHRLVTFLALPLTLLAVAYQLALDFPTFAADDKLARNTLLVRLGWQRAVTLHHSLLLAAYLVLAGGFLLNLPPSLLWPAFLTFPLAIYQIVMLRNIALGVKPLWNVLTANGVAIFAFTVWLLALTFWLR